MSTRGRHGASLWAFLVLMFLVLGAYGCSQAAIVQEPFEPVVDLTDGLPVVPGIEGYGTTTPAGRGGKVLRVTTLAPEGPGSLRAALLETGPRVVVFEVAGVIDTTQSLVIQDPSITVAGQTAPSPGITVIGAGLVIAASDVLVQHLRFRVGDRAEGPDPEGRDGISVFARRDVGRETANVVIDHCSVSWAIDEGISAMYYDVHDVTIRQCITAENLSRSIHPEREHSKGLLIGDHTRRIAAIGNLMAHNVKRNPIIKGDVSTVVLNNLVYNPLSKAMHFSDPENSGCTFAAIVGNVLIPGPNTRVWMPFVAPLFTTDRGTRMYLLDNVIDEGGKSGRDIVRPRRDHVVYEPPARFEPMTVLPAREVTEWVLANAGARPADRDEVDKRIVASVRNRTGKIIDSQEEVGGFPEAEPVTRALELPGDPNGDDDGDGYTNLEEWLHALAVEVEGNSASD